ncbi:uncharacterized protein LOC130231085 [Danio aesculapii]|uniref:uncharacterized protein LOC130231085 n=1 Tax=Danio aesculapii TaxID=1142201 RepID=UPI0024BF55C6|nr:uncharacterized protein LOC130231085 [Danio aesculapii]
MKRTKEIRENEMNEEQEEHSGKEDSSKEIKTNAELPEEYYHGLEDLPWNLNSLEELLYISLPACIQRVLLCNLAEQFGVWTFHNNFLPCRLISYALLPYTLPATALISFIYRFLCWLKTFLQQALNAGKELKQEVMVNLRFALTNMGRLLLNRRSRSTGAKTSPSALASSSVDPALSAETQHHYKNKEDFPQDTNSQNYIIITPLQEKAPDWLTHIFW